jgi:hypothetical protein
MSPLLPWKLGFVHWSLFRVGFKVGAFLNEACQAKEGIEASIFPTHLPVYTGHYHKPHVVEGTQIEYIGSPYQVSAGESEQTKHFLVLNRHWQAGFPYWRLISYSSQTCDFSAVLKQILAFLTSTFCCAENWRNPCEYRSTAF